MTAPKTSKDFQKLAHDRALAARLASTLQLETEHKARLAALAEANPWELLSTEEMLALDQAKKKEQHEKAAARQNLTNLAQWILSRPEIPADPAAGAAVVQWCQARGLDTGNPANLDRAFNTLVEEEVIIPNYTESNRRQHEEHVDYLRANGLRIQAPPTLAELESMPLEDLISLSALAEQSDKGRRPIVVPEVETPNFEVPHVHSFEDFQ